MACAFNVTALENEPPLNAIGIVDAGPVIVVPEGSVNVPVVSETTIVTGVENEPGSKMILPPASCATTLTVPVDDCPEENVP